MTKKLFMLACVAALVSPGRADTEAPAPAPAEAARVSIAAAEMPLREVARSLADQTGRRILIGPETTGRLTMNVADVSLEAAVSVTARLSDNRWTRITLPADRAKSLSPDQALALVTAAETLAASAVAVQSGDGPAVTVGPASAPTAATETVYFVHTKADVAAIRAAREAAEKAKEEAETPSPGVAAAMSEDARADPQVVGAYAALQMLSPNQVAVLTREFLIHSTPEQRQSLGEAFAQQREQLRDAFQREAGHQ